MKELRCPAPVAMLNELRRAGIARRWNHFYKDLEKHKVDWQSAVGVFSQEEYSRLPILVAEADEVELCTYIYMGRRVWGFYVRQLHLLQKGAYLSEVLIIFDPIAEEIIHCMRPDAVRPYCMRRKDFVSIRGRWRRR